MRYFLYPLLLAVALLVVFAEIATPMLQHKQAINTLPIHKTLYLSRDIYDDQMLHIVAATMEWNQVTNGDVTFDIKRLPYPKINPSDAIIMMNVTPDYPEIIILDNLNQYSTLAFFNDDSLLAYIGLIDVRIPNSDYDAVIMHELGHSLGLEHIKGIDGVGTLMCPTITLGASHITKEDLYQFCKLYHCDARKYHVISEVQ
jgi:Matrixin